MSSRNPTPTPRPIVPAPKMRAAGTAYLVMHQSARNGYEEAFADPASAEAFRLACVARHPKYGNDDFFVEEVDLRTLTDDGGDALRREHV